MAGSSYRMVFWVKLSSLPEDTRENEGKDSTFSIVLIICKLDTLLKTALGVRADQVG